MKKLLPLLLAGLTLSLSVSAQGTLDDYNRAYSMRSRYGADKVINASIEPHWMGKSHSFWYVSRNAEKGSNDYLLVNADKG
ncbi:MAG: S9 family peptidase, partial [Bacteroidaceae bacterium]|nr:S9 family peptidase [Bacteroidaceae bacterium]